MSYKTLKARIAPGLRFNQDIYETLLAEHVRRDTIWLDAGCGKHALPPWRAAAEAELTRRPHLSVGCDADEPALRLHGTLRHRVVADLGHLPFKSDSVTLITTNMVVEHLDPPLPVFEEFARVLAPGGRIIVHTPYAHSYYVLASRFLPERLKLRLIRRLESRDETEAFPTRYRANTPRRLRTLMARAGLRQEEDRLLASDAVLARVHPLLAAVELLYIRLSLRPAFRRLRVSMLATFLKGPLCVDDGSSLSGGERVGQKAGGRCAMRV